jgi:hypothetical protein
MKCCAIAATLSLMAWSGSSTGAGDTYYRWNDASGNPVNSDRPPPAGIEYDVITTNTNTRVDERADQRETPQSGSSGTDGTADQQNMPVPLMEFEKDPKACAIAQQNLETLNAHARIRMPDEDGNFRYLNEEEKANARIEAEAAISQNCE